LPGLTEAQQQAFLRGRSLFHQSWVVAPANDTQTVGLGPLYNRLACISCHAKNGRGKAPAGPQERMQSMLVRLSLPGAGPHGGPRPHPVYGDQLNEEGIPGVPGEGRAELRWEEQHVTLADGEVVNLRRPRIKIVELGYGPLGAVLMSPRVGQPVFGLGLLQAVPLATVQALAHEAKPDGVRGQVNAVWDVATQHTADGRFGWKANQPSLRQQIAGAMIGDLGITSPLFPNENCTPTQTACRAAPSGGQPELKADQLEDIHSYLSLLAVPARRDRDLPAVREGEALFAATGCAVCHRPALTTGASDFAALAYRHIAPYSDLLIHDLGPGLADGRADFAASGRHWRTPALWGIGLSDDIGEGSGYLHDGRARTLQEAVLWHAGEAGPARKRYASLSKRSREALLTFLRSL
jgi:CxxC motif-containing protein (DUF1111 family)